MGDHPSNGGFDDGFDLGLRGMSTTTTKASTIGHGAARASLTIEELREIVRERLSEVASGSRVLAIIPDKTRDDNTHLLFPIVAEELVSRNIDVPDVLVAQGTHPAMSESDKLAKMGVSSLSEAGENGHSSEWHGRVFDHGWNRPDELVTLGELNSSEVRRLTGGLMEESIALTANRLLGRGVYDTVLVLGATMPHRVAGFSGGAKYFFPGVAGPELTHATHWLGALSGIEHVIGKVETPIRALIEAAVEFVTPEVVSFNSVVSRDASGALRTHGLFAGDIREAFRRAAAVSSRVHIKYSGRRYKRIVALLDEHYDDMWVGGK